MAKPSDKNQQIDTDNPQPAKKKVTRKRVAKKAVKAVAETPPPEPEPHPDPTAKKKVPRKRAPRKPAAAPNPDNEASTSGAHGADVNQKSPGNAPEPRPEKGEVRRESGSQNSDRQEDGDKKRRRRRRRRGGDGRDDDQSGDSRSNDEPSKDREDDNDPRPASQRVKVRQPESQRKHDRRPSRYTENPDLLAKYAWQLYKGEIREEGGTLIEDRDAKKIAERAFRMAEIFLMEQSRMG